MPNAIQGGSGLKTFNVSAKALFMDALKGGSPITYDRIAGQISGVTTDEVEFPMLKPLTSVREWIGDRVYQTIEKSDFRTTMKKFEKSLEINRDDVEADNIGIYSDLFRQLGDLFRRWPDEQVWALWKNGETAKCYDGQPFFSASHPVGSTTASNLVGGAGAAWYLVDTTKVLKPIYWIPKAGREPKLLARDRPDDPHVVERDVYRYNGDAKGIPAFGVWQLALKSKATLDDTSLNSAITTMRSYKDEAGENLGIVPNLLVVDQTNQVAAEKLINAQILANGASNTNYKKVDILVVNRLG